MSTDTDHLERAHDESDGSAAEEVIWKVARKASNHILSVKDRIPYLTEQDNRRLRSVVIREFNDFADLCVNLLRSADEGAVNQDVLDLLKDIHQVIVK